MSNSTLTSKGQMTVPADIRSLLNLRTGDRLEFIPQEDGTITLIPANVDIKDLPGILPKPRKKASLEDIENAIREGGSKKGMKALDTNVLLRYLVKDDRTQFETARAYIHKHCTEETPGYVNLVVLCELVWVLDRRHEYTRVEIATILENILRTDQLTIENSGLAWEALRSYRAGKADFADHLIGKVNRRAGCTNTATFDKVAGKLEEFELL